MATTDTVQWFVISLLCLAVSALATVTAAYAKENRKLWQAHLQPRKGSGDEQQKGCD